MSATERWARFGDRTVVWSGPAPALVTQVGRAFQDAYPEVPVLLDRGRHLVVDDGGALRGRVDTCWRVEPLPADTVVVDVAQPPPAARIDPTAAEVVAALSRQRYADEIGWLAALHTRHSLSPGYATAADRVAATLDGLGFAIRREPVEVGVGLGANVVADLAADPPGGALVVLCAHLDSVNVAGGPSAPAPGADDNASGAAGVLEMARILAGRRWRHDLRVILFGGEEQGLNGSRRHVAALPADERARIRAVLNLDMVAARTANPASVLLEGGPVSRSMMDDLTAAATAHTGLRVETSLNPFASDHVPFIEAGLPAVLTIEGSDSANGRVHGPDDLPAHLDLDFALEILRMDVAALAGWLEPIPSGS